MAKSKERLVEGIAPMALGCAVYAFFQRSYQDFVTYAVPVAFVVGVFLGIGAIRELWRSRATLTWRRIVTTPIIVVVVSAVLGLIYYSLGVVIWDLFNHWHEIREFLWPWQISPAIVTALATLICGTILFFFRLKFRSMYGLTEAVIGVVVAISKIAPTMKGSATIDTEIYLAILTAGVYLVVRGMDNVHQGIVNETPDPLATKALLWFRQSLGNEPTNPA